MKFSFTKSWTVILTLLALTFSAIGVTPAHAASFTVNSTTDAVDVTPGNGMCETALHNGICTLRAAIQEANALGGDNTITLPAGTYALTIGGAGEDLAVTGDLDINSNITINGAGADTTIIDGGLGDRVFHVTEAVTVNISGVTVRNGSGVSSGGGILNASGTLTITNSVFSGNIVSGGGGGGIFHNAGTLIIMNSTFSGNASGGYGGGIETNSGTATITNSTFSGNSAFAGGGIFEGFTTLTITNSTFSGNSASAGYGGGIYRDNPGGTVTLLNTIVANSLSGGNCAGTITNGGNNIDDGTTCGWGAVSGSKSSTPPLLGALANNGGPTQTLALLTGSPAIDGVTFNGSNSAPSTDQRGVARPQGVRSDIGAFESQAQAGPAFIVNTSADTNDGFCDILGQGLGNDNCTLREAINAANAHAGADTITFSVSGTITLASTLPTITDTAGLTMDGTGQTLTISGNNAVQVMHVLAGASLTLNHLTIANGYAGFGGGIDNSGTLTITNSTFSGNNSYGFGGGVFSNSGTLTITNSTFSGNSTNQGAGAGIYNNRGTLTITNSTFSGNIAVRGDGAGIANYGTATITNSTFSGNSATGGAGAGINNASGTLTITNSTFSGNSANQGFGAGIYNNGGPLTITNSTFSGNSTSTSTSNGAGIYNNNVAAQVTLRNTIVANSGSGGNCFGGITNGGNNIDDGATCGWGAASGSKSSTNPLLGALANNGGPTQTLALLTGSPAIDGVTFNGSNSAPSTDQRGIARPQGTRYDIGSYELFTPTKVNLPWLFLLLGD